MFQLYEFTSEVKYRIRNQTANFPRQVDTIFHLAT